MSLVTEMPEVIAPLVRNYIEVPDSSLSFTAACFEGTNWSLKPLREPEDVDRNFEFARQVGSALSGLNVARAYAPNPTEFNARIIMPGALNRIILLPAGGEGTILLCRNTNVPADGTFLVNQGDAGIFSAAGCSAIVVACGQTLIFAHAGRDCVLDRKLVEFDVPSRPHESVVHAILDALGAATDLSKVHAWVMYSIKPEDFLHRFDDAMYGNWNKAAERYVPEHFGPKAGIKTSEGILLDIPEIAKRQFTLRGVPEENIHLEHAYLSDELPHTRKGAGRYLVAIVRD